MVGSHRSFLFPIPLLFMSWMALCQSFDGPARGLAQKIGGALARHETVTLSMRTLSSMAATDLPTARAALERELRAQGLTIRAQGGVELAVTISENARGSLWVAEIRRRDERDLAIRDVVIEQAPRPQGTSTPVSTAAMTIEKKLLFEQEEPILDLAAAGAATLVLDSAGVSLHESAQVTRIAILRTLPRDARGRLVVAGGAYQAYLPGVICSGTTAPTLTASCREEALWPLSASVRASFAPARNFFDGRIITAAGPEKNVTPFFSAAAFEDRGRSAWLLAGADGGVHLYSAALEPSGGWTGWGSDIAGIESDCGARSQVLATRSGDTTAVDSVQAYQILGGSPQAAGDAVTFPGPVTALWPAAERGAALAVARDLRSGRYAAFRLAITCGH
jgi:hypothetical protein